MNTIFSFSVEILDSFPQKQPNILKSSNPYEKQNTDMHQAALSLITSTHMIHLLLMAQKKGFDGWSVHAMIICFRCMNVPEFMQPAGLYLATFIPLQEHRGAH